MSDTWSTGPSSTGTGVQERAGEVAGTAKEQAGEVAATAKEQAASVASTATEQAKTVAADARHEARRLIDNSRQQLRDQAGEQSQRAASSLRDLGDQLQRMASGQAPGEGPAADLARQASQGIQQLADSLERKRPEELLDDVKRFARQRPGLFLLGALGAGFAAGRLVRAVDTSAIADAAKAGAGMGQDQGSAGMVSGPGTLGALGGGMPGATPADLVEGTGPIPTAAPTHPQAAPTHPPRTEPLRAPGTTGSEW